MRFVCTSDTHNNHRDGQYPKGDILILAGDFTETGNLQVLIDLNDFLATLDYRYKILVTGNHDILFEVIENKMISEVVTNAIFLDNSGININGINIFGTSFNQKYWKQQARSNGKKFKTDIIPDDTDILISHEPPYGYLDRRSEEKDHLGSKLMYNAIYRVKPRYHIFGHIHEAYGRIDTKIDGSDITFFNCSATSKFGVPLRSPHVFDFEIN